MSKLLIGYIPLLLATIVMLIWAIRKKKLAFLIGCLVYFALAIGIAASMGATNYSAGDPQLVAGGISENIVSVLLLAIFEIPILAVIFWVYKWWQSKKPEKS